MRIILVLLFSSSISALGPDQLYQEAQSYQRLKKPQKAIESLEELIDQHPHWHKNRVAVFELGKLELQVQDYLNAIAWFNRLRRDYAYSNDIDEALYLTAKAYRKLGLYRRAEIYFNQYLEKGKKTRYKFQAHIFLARMLHEKRQYREAAEKYNQVILFMQQHPELKDKKLIADTYYRMGMLHARKLNNEKTAYRYLHLALENGYPHTVNLKFLLRKLSIERITRSDGLPDNAIADIRVDGDDIYIATWGGGLTRYSRSTEKFRSLRLPTSQLRSIYNTDDAVYICSFDGIFMFNKKDNKTYELTTDNEVFRIAQKVIKDDRYLYFTTLTKGVIQYDLYRKKISVLNHKSFLKTSQVYSVDANLDFLVFGTINHGVVIKNKLSGETTYLNTKTNHLKGNNVKALLLDGRYLWIGVHRHGIYRYDLQQKKIKHFDWDMPYPSSIAKRANEIWIGSSGNGLRIYDRETRKVKKLTVIDGLSSNEILLIRPEDDFIWVGYLDKGLDILYRPLQDE